jgi:hypothetical protein
VVGCDQPVRGFDVITECTRCKTHHCALHRIALLVDSPYGHGCTGLRPVIIEAWLEKQATEAAANVPIKVDSV